MVTGSGVLSSGLPAVVYRTVIIRNGVPNSGYQNGVPNSGYQTVVYRTVVLPDSGVPNSVYPGLVSP